MKRLVWLVQLLPWFALLLSLTLFFWSVLLKAEDHTRKISPFDILKIQVLLERSGRVKAELDREILKYEKLQAEIQTEIRSEVSRIYADAELKQADFDLDLQKAEFTPKKKDGSK